MDSLDAVQAPQPVMLDAAYRESAYLLGFPDIGDVVADGVLPSGLDHFLRVGRAEMLAGTRRVPEGFRPVPVPPSGPGLCFGVSRDTFEEALYAALFPQIARLVSQHVFASLFDHWLECGYGDMAAGQQRAPFMARQARGDAPARRHVAQLDQADYLMAFAPAGSAALDPMGQHRVEVREYRSVHVGAMLARPFGVNFFAPFTSPGPLGHTARATLRALGRAGLDVDTWPYREQAGALEFVAGAWTRRPRYRVNLVLVPPDGIGRLCETFAPGTLDDAFTVALLPWQLCPVRPEHLFAFADVDEVWTGSEFEAAAVARVAKVPVHTLPVLPAEPGGASRGQAGACVFATLLGPGELGRRSALATIEAFRMLARPDATLVVAGEGADSLPAAMASNVRFEPGALTDEGLRTLLDGAACFVAGHPDAEGSWGTAAALQAGTPVIGMRHGAMAELLDETVGYPVDYRLAELEVALPPYQAGMVWAEPCAGSLLECMREAMQDTGGRATRAQAAAQHAAGFSVASVGAAIARRLAALNLDVPKPGFMDRVGGRPALPAGPGVAPGAAMLWPQLSFSLLATVARDSDPSDLQAMLDAAQSQTYGLWELVLQPDAGPAPAVLAWLDAVRGSSPRINVLPPPGPGGSAGLVESARGRYVVYGDPLESLRPDVLERMVALLRDEPATDVVRGAGPAGLLGIRKQILLGLGHSDLRPAEALASAFRARLQQTTRLARSLPEEK